MITTWDKMLVSVMLLAAALSFLGLRGALGHASQATERQVIVAVGGTVKHQLALNKDTRLAVDSKAGLCVIEIRSSKARVIRSDCPQKLCVQQGTLSGAKPIVCLPHQVVITMSDQEESGYDAVVR